MGSISRIRPAVACVALALCIVLTAPFSTPTKAEGTVSVEFFHDSLAPHGYWVEHPSYGRVWRPGEVSDDWRPYMYGRWVWTSEYGWVWASDEQWGWAVYHYGRWVWTTEHGWVWAPHDEWGPSWVEWCYGDGYVGWYPMPPDTYWNDRSYYTGSLDCSAPRYRRGWVFVAEAYFASPRMSTYIVPASQNATVSSRTVNVTNYTRVRGAIINRSVDVNRLQRSTGQTIKPVRVLRAQHPGGRPSTEELRALSIYRPTVTALDKPTLDVALPPRLNLEPELKSFSLTPPPVTTYGGTTSTLPPVSQPPLATPPPTGLPSGLPEPGGLGAPSVGGALGGIRGRIGK